MSFLAPAFLLLAGAAAVPLLLHLLRRRIGARVEFPAVRYLARAEREHSRKLRLRNILLMLLRVAAVLLVALAAARPVARFGAVGQAGGHEPTALAIVIDNSLSTSAVVDGRSVLDRLKEIARLTLDRATGADRLWLVTSDGRITGGDAGALRAALDALEPLAGAGNPSAALTAAANVARGAGLAAAEVTLLTDAQATTWQRQVALGDIAAAVFIPDVIVPSNRAVIAATPQPALWTPRGAIAARILAPDSVTYRVTLTGQAGVPRTLARGTAASTGAAAGDSAAVLVRSSPPERGWVAGAVELEPDELRADDVRYFAVWIGPPPAVTIAPGAGPFVESAVASLADAGRLSHGDAVTVGPADAVGRLPALLSPPTDPVRLGAANRSLERLGIPWRFGAARRGEAAVRGARLDDVTASLRYELLSLDAVQADTLARIGSEPWIVAGDRYVVVASPLIADATTLPVRAAFVPWLHDVLSQRLSGAGASIIETAPNDTVARPAWAEALETVGGDAGGQRLTGPTIRAPETPGVYFLVRGGRRAGALVVNPEAGESILDRLSSREMERRLDAREVRVVDRDSRWVSAIFASRTSRPLIVPFLVAALLTLAAESLVASGGARRSS